MAGLLGRGSKTAPVRYLGMQVSTSLQGQVIPYVAGRQRVTMNLLWYGAFRSAAQYSGGGKGSGGNPTSFAYNAAYIGGLALGPIQGIHAVWYDRSTTTLALQNLAYALGTSGQPTWSGFPSGTPADQGIPYDHIAYVAASSYYLGSSPSMPNLTFEIEGVVPGYDDANGVFDADPSAIVTDYLTDPVHGAAFQGTIASLQGATNTYQAYCLALGLVVSPYENNQRAAADFLRELMQITNSDLVLSCGTLKVVPYADQPVSGTTADGKAWSYTPDLTPVYSFGDGDFCPRKGEEPVKLIRKPLTDTYNIVNLDYLDRANFYNQGAASASDAYDISFRGPRAMATLSFNQITQASVARTVAQLILQFQLYERNSYEFRVRADYALLEPMDYIAITDSGLGLADQVCRITKIQDGGDNLITITAMEVPGTVRTVPQYNWSSGQGYAANFDESPGSVAAPVIFQMPPFPGIAAGTIGIAVGPPTTSTSWGGCEVYVSADGGNTYDLAGIIAGAGPARYGTLTAALSEVADPDTTSTLSVLLGNTNEQLSTAATQADADSERTLILVGQGASAEIMAYGAAALVSAGAYNLTYLRRGLYGSSDQAHASGDPFVRLDGSIFLLPLGPGMAGQTLNFKFCSFNSVGRALEDISAVTAYPYSVPTATQLGVQPALVARGSAVVAGNVVYKGAGAASAWDSDAYSGQGYQNGCFLSWRAASAATQAMAGLSTNPVSTPSDTKLNFAFYQDAGSLQVYESGTAVGTFGTYAAGDAFELRYDGVTVRYFHNGALVRAVRAAGLTLYPAACLYSAGSVLSALQFGPSAALNQVASSWLNNYPWAVGTSGSQGNYADYYDGTNEDSSIVLGGIAGAPLGPYGTSEALWKAVGAGTSDNGGWSNSGDLYGIDPTKTYRSCVWIYWNGVGTPYLNLEFDQAHTETLAGASAPSPQVFNAQPATLGIAGGKWYLAVGILHGSGYTNGASSGVSGIWDPATGLRVLAGTDFMCAAGAPGQTQLVTQGGANDASCITYFARPRWDEVTGSEPSIPSLLAPASLDAIPDGAARFAARWYYLQNGSAAAWYKLGTWVSTAYGATLRLEYTGGAGFNTNSAQQSHATCLVRLGDQVAAPNLSGLSWWENGGAPGIVALKAAATGGSTAVANQSWDVYVELNPFATGQWEIILNPGDTFTWDGTAATDPGVASSTVVVGTGGQLATASNQLATGTASTSALVANAVSEFNYGSNQTGTPVVIYFEVLSSDIPAGETTVPVLILAGLGNLPAGESLDVTVLQGVIDMSTSQAVSSTVSYEVPEYTYPNPQPTGYTTEQITLSGTITPFQTSGNLYHGVSAGTPLTLPPLVAALPAGTYTIALYNSDSSNGPGWTGNPLVSLSAMAMKR